MRDNYPLYRHWYKTLNWVLDTVERLPKKARFSIASRIADYSLEIMESIVDAIYSKTRAHYLDKINRNLEQLRVLFRLCHDRKYLSRQQFEYISRALNEAGRMTGGWKKSDGKTS